MYKLKSHIIIYEHSVAIYILVLQYNICNTLLETDIYKVDALQYIN